MRALSRSGDGGARVLVSDEASSADSSLTYRAGFKFVFAACTCAPKHMVSLLAGYSEVCREYWCYMITFTRIRNNPGWLLYFGRAVISLVISLVDHTTVKGGKFLKKLWCCVGRSIVR